MWTALKHLGRRIFTLSNSIRIGFVILISGATIIITTSTPFLFGALIKGGNVKFLEFEFAASTVILLYGASLGTSKLLQYIRKMLLNPVISKVNYEVVYEYNEQLMQQPHSYHLMTPLGDKQERMVMARTATPEFTTLLLNNIIPASLEMGATIGILTRYYGWEIGSWVFGIVTFSLIYNSATAGFISKAQAKFIKDRGASTRYSAALWTNFESVYYFNNLKFEFEELQKNINQLQQSNLRNLHTPEIISLVHGLFAQGMLLGLIAYVGQKVLTKEYSTHDLSIIAYFLMQIMLPLNNLGESTGKIRAASHELEPIIDFLRKKQATAQKPALILKDENTKIVFDKVAFYYQEKEPLLENISFEAEAGKTIALVGLSGGGKTTITRLLFRFYDPTQGQILINEQDITQVDVSSLRNILSIVPQNPVLYNNTLRYNIAYGALSVSDKEVTDMQIWDAIKSAGLYDFVNQSSEKLDMLVGERGLKLSGGQLLRVAIARAIIRNARIVVLDEYTSALDPETERFIQDQLNNILADKIKIIIAHRLTTIQHADKIIVLNKGKIAESGNFQELTDANGLFKQLWDKQQKSQRPAEEADGKLEGAFGNQANFFKSPEQQQKSLESKSASDKDPSKEDKKTEERKSLLSPHNSVRNYRTINNNDDEPSASKWCCGIQ